VAGALQHVFGEVANDLGRRCGVIRRQRQFSGSTLAQTLVFGWLSKPEATVEDLAHQAAVCGVQVSAQSVQERFTPALATFLQQLLAVAVGQAVAGAPAALPLLRRFRGVYVNDSTTITLPGEFAAAWPACGGDGGQSAAALKVHVRVDFDGGRLLHLVAEPGRRPDRAEALPEADLPPGSLRLADLGFFSIEALDRLGRGGVYWLTRLQPGTSVFAADDTPLEPLAAWLRRQRQPVIDVPVRLGAQHRLPCRLVAVRAPGAVVRRRLDRLARDARRRGRPVSELQRQWAGWTIYATNLPAALANWQEVCVLYRVRWQIELLFKLWKSHGRIATSRSPKPERVLAEVFAKLLAMVVQHWMLLVTAWPHANRSLTKAAERLRYLVEAVALALPCLVDLCRVLERMRASFQERCRLNRRHAQPSTYQLLEDPTLLTYGVT
jgi:hypothetical protein